MLSKTEGERPFGFRGQLPPYAGVSRIRFGGSERARSLSTALSGPPGNGGTLGAMPRDLKGAFAAFGERAAMEGSSRSGGRPSPVLFWQRDAKGQTAQRGARGRQTRCPSRFRRTKRSSISSALRLVAVTASRPCSAVACGRATASWRRGAAPCPRRRSPGGYAATPRPDRLRRFPAGTASAA